VPLTAQRSLAVDTSFTPYGTPIWIDTQRPVAGKPGALEIYRGLLIAQDTGAGHQGPGARRRILRRRRQCRRLGRPHVGSGQAIVLVPNRG
jgi:membrane-bound lytic murein transglycosylase A